MKYLYPLLLILFVTLFGCKKDEESNVQESEETPSHAHIKYFGFALIDVYWDDPLDEEVKINYSDEVHSFCNIADILVVNPQDNIVSKLNAMLDFEMKSYLHLHEIFFEYIDDDAPSGSNYDLRSDYQLRWDEFVQVNSLETNFSAIQAFYVGEEPTWNGISFEEMEEASHYIKTSIPEVPIMLVEAYPILDELQVPESVDWVGFDHYFIKDPTTDPIFQSELQTLKSKFSTDDQKLVIVMDSHYIPWAHGDFGGIEEEEMTQVATNYFNLAVSESKTIAIIGYTWPGGFDSADMLGARQLSMETQNEYQRIGGLITGK